MVVVVVLGGLSGLLHGRLRVEYPPAGLAGALVLHADEAVVEGQVVADGVLEQEASLTDISSA